MSDEKEQTDEELAGAAKRGDLTAYDVLVRRYLRPAMALAWQFTHSVADSEDIVQEAFHRTVRSLASYDESRAFSAWFYTIVRNVASTALTKAGRRASLAPLRPLDDVPEPEAKPPIDPDLAEDVDQALERLAPSQRACLHLCDIEGFTSVEAARMLGIDDATVRTHRRRALEKLRLLLDPEKGLLPQ